MINNVKFLINLGMTILLASFYLMAYEAHIPLSNTVYCLSGLGVFAIMIGMVLL